MFKALLDKLIMPLVIVIVVGFMGFVAGWLAVALSKIATSVVTPQKIKLTLVMFTATGVVMGLLIAYRYIKNSPPS